LKYFNKSTVSILDVQEADFLNNSMQDNKQNSPDGQKLTITYTEKSLKRRHESSQCAIYPQADSDLESNMNLDFLERNKSAKEKHEKECIEKSLQELELDYKKLHVMARENRISKLNKKRQTIPQSLRSEVNQSWGETDEIRLEVRAVRLWFEREQCICIILKDISLNEKLAEEKLKQKYKSLLFKTLSHELKTPMNGIIGNIELILTCSDNTEVLSLAKNANRNAQILLYLINNATAFTQIQSHNFNIHIQQTPLLQLIDECIALFVLEFNHRNLNFKLHLAQDVPEAVYSDPQLLKQIIVILLGNATKHTFKGFIRFSVRLDADAPRLLVFKIADSGCGIPKRKLENVFQLFSDIDAKEDSHGIFLKNEFCKYLVRN
jgi:signal transduction histidine kinase